MPYLTQTAAVQWKTYNGLKIQVLFREGSSTNKDIFVFEKYEN
jgi:hypothetical protein